ncbi:MTBP protein, partial [Molothrus ater]|nr:MTBP protein [Molothrus ater]
TAADMYQFLKESCNASINADVSTFPACSVAGIPGAKKWYFASHVICGFYQFCSSDWEEINVDTQKNEDSYQASIDENLGTTQSFEEDDSNSQESLSLTDIYDEAAESLHQLADKLPAPGRAMVDVILQAVECDGPKLKDCLPAIGALKHLREWHSAQITIAARDAKGSWQKIADYLSADFVSSDDIMNIIDLNELWRGKIQIWERRFASGVDFPEFCIKSTSAKTLRTANLSSCFAAKKECQLRNTDTLPEASFYLISFQVFHYYGPALEFLQMVVLSDLPSIFISDLEFELSLSRKNNKKTSTLLLDQISFLSGKVGALFTLPCYVSSEVIPSPAQLSSKKWKEYMAKKPKVISVPEIELKGESCRYYFLLQGNGSGGCKATLIHSAGQINGMATLAAVNGKLKAKAEETESGFHISDFIKSLPCYYGEDIVQRETKLSRLQVFALKEYLKRKELTKQPVVISTNEFKSLLKLTRECFLDLCSTNLPKPVLQKVCNKTRSCTETHGKVVQYVFLAEPDLIEPNPLEWPERHVLQNLENFEKNKQKMRVPLFAHSPEQLLGHKDSQRESLTLLDAKELLKYFTPEGLPVGELQPLQVPKRLSLTGFSPNFNFRYCLDDRRALERDVGYAELQTRLIRYETQTTCTKECCPVPLVLSPLPSPAVLSEPGSVPDGETLQSEFKTETSRLKRRSKDLDYFYPKKRLTKSESTESLLWQAGGSSRSLCAVAVPRKRSDRSPCVAAAPSKPPGHGHRAASRAGPAAQPEPAKPEKESRSQKHTRMLKEVVAKTLQKHGIAEDHKCFASCSQRLFEISKFYLKDLKTSRGLLDEMKKTANSNAKQV